MHVWDWISLKKTSLVFGIYDLQVQWTGRCPDVACTLNTGWVKKQTNKQTKKQ